MTKGTMTDGRRLRGERSRREILALAVDIASAEGLEGLTIGRLAGELGMSKSGLFAHFGSKEGLQSATVGAAADNFANEVVAPTDGVEPGIERLHAMLGAWTAHIDCSRYRGGCFFAATGLEFDGRPGAVRTLIADLSRRWVQRIVEEARLSRELGQLRDDVDPEQLAFETHAFVQEANWTRQLLEDERAFERARAAIRRRLLDSSTESGAAILNRASEKGDRDGK